MSCPNCERPGLGECLDCRLERRYRLETKPPADANTEPICARCGQVRSASGGDIHCVGDCDSGVHDLIGGCHKFEQQEPCKDAICLLAKDHRGRPHLYPENWETTGANTARPYSDECVIGDEHPGQPHINQYGEPFRRTTGANAEPELMDGPYGYRTYKTPTRTPSAARRSQGSPSNSMER